MPNVKQIYAIVNSINKQAFGENAIVATDASWVSVGNQVLSTASNKDAWYGALADRIGKTLTSYRPYEGKKGRIRKNEMDFGIALQKLYVELPEAVTNTTWNGQSVAATDPFTKSATVVHQKIFAPFAPYEYDITIPDVQLETAFTNPTAMAAFIESVFGALYNAREAAMENVTALQRAAMIASKKVKGGAGYQNVLAAYKAQTGDNTVTSTNYENSPEFLRFLVSYISKFSGRMTKLSVNFNEDGVVRHTPKDMQNLDVLSDVAEAIKVNLQSDTFHKDLVSLPGYEAVEYWQGSDQGNYDLADISKVMVQLDGETTTTVTGVLAVLYDVETLGTTITKQRTRSIYNPKDEYTNYFDKAEIGRYYDTSENAIVFYVAD